MNKYLIILIFTSYVGCGNLYGQDTIPTEVIKKSQVVSEDTIPPIFEIKLEALRTFEYYLEYNEYYDSEENVLVLNAHWCAKFPEDFYKINTDYYFNITDDSESFTVTFKDSLLQSSLIRYYEAIDASGNKSNLEVWITRSGTPGQISNLYVHINDSDEPLFFSPGDEGEREVYLCDNTEVKIDAVPQLVCPDHSANYFWYINDKALITERNSILVFNLDTMSDESIVSITVSESGSINGRIKIIKLTDELVKTIVQPTCDQSNDGYIQLDNVYDVVWKHNGSTSNYLENLGPGVYPVSYKCQSGCDFNDIITLVPVNVNVHSDLVIFNPTCLNSGDGSISLESNVENVKWEYNNSNALNLTSLNPGSYYVSYTYNGCNVNDIITLVPKNILDFAVSNTIIDLTQNEILTIHNLSKGFDEFQWQIGDSILPTNIKDDVIEYTFTTPGDYEIRLSELNVNCDMAIKKVKVIGTTSSLDYSISSVKIGPNPFKDFINIDFAEYSDYYLKIYGVDGRVYFTDQISDMRNFKADLSFLNSGVYVLKIISVKNSELIKGYKIVKFDY